LEPWRTARPARDWRDALTGALAAKRCGTRGFDDRFVVVLFYGRVLTQGELPGTSVIDLRFAREKRASN